jgi:predicted ArsR family transcriptional regulator
MRLLFAADGPLVVPSIFRAIEQVGGRDLTKKVLKRVSQSIVDHYRPRITGRSPRERLHQIAELWSEEGHLVEVVENEKKNPVLRKRSCGYISMFEETRTICGVDMDVIAALVQAPLRRVECRHDGGHCCAFELVPTSGKG